MKRITQADRDEVRAMTPDTLRKERQQLRGMIAYLQSRGVLIRREIDRRSKAGLWPYSEKCDGR